MALESPQKPVIGDMVHFFELERGAWLGPYAATVTDVMDEADDHRVHLTVFRPSRFTGDLISGEEFVEREGREGEYTAPTRRWRSR